MGADILERLRKNAARFHPHATDLIREAAAEIVRLRGEVENITAEAIEWRDKLQASTPEPAMPNGVEDIDWPFTYIVPDSKHEYVPKHHAERKIRDALRAADNRDAAGVAVRERDCTQEAADKFYQDGWNACLAANTPAAAPAGEATIAPAEANGDLSALERLAWNWKNIDVPLGDVGSSATLERCANELRAVIATMTIPQPADGEAVALGWRVRERRSSDGELLDCFIEAPPVDGMAYGLEVLGDDYTGYGDVEGKLAHCKMIVAWANATTPPAPVQAAPQEGEADWKCVISVLEHGIRDGIHGGYNASYIKQQIRALQHRGDSQEVWRG